MKKILSHENEKLLIDKYLSGIPCSELSLKFGMSRSGIATFLSRKGIKRPKKNKEIKQPIKLTASTKKDILTGYALGERISALSLEYNVPASSIRRWFKRECLKTRTDKRGEEKKYKIIELHSKGLTTKEIKEEIGATYHSVIQTLWKEGLKPNKIIIKRSNIEECYFKVLDNDTKNYLFGLLCADGSVDQNIGRVSICLKLEDSYLLQKLKEELNSSAPIVVFPYRIGNNMGSRIQVYSQKLVSDLVRHGCIQRKSKGFHFPNVEEKYFWSFLRGYIDGNGSISKDGARLSICSPPKFNEDLNCILKEKYNITSCLSGQNTYSDLIITKQEYLLDIRKSLYNEAILYMKRKKERFLKGNYLINVNKKVA